jgi:glutaminyl-tRNA synthetase
MSTNTNPKTEISSSRRIGPNFITEIIDRDLEQQRYTSEATPVLPQTTPITPQGASPQRKAPFHLLSQSTAFAPRGFAPKGGVVTRFPPNPNGFAHLGHAFASLLNFGIAKDYGGRFVLRFDDTNPHTDKPEFVESISKDLAWLGLDWGSEISYASSYFPQLHAYAVTLIERGLAYVDSVTAEEMARLRGTAFEPGKPSPYRDRTVQENLEMFEKMRLGEFPDGSQVLRAKIDLANPNFKLRDPVLYRIVHATHYRTGDDWCIYPSYDFAQAITDALDGVTHSLCSLEFIDNNAVYRWLMENLWDKAPPIQYEFGRRSLEYTVVSKRKLKKLVEGKHVNGWDDPRMPTIAAQRRRGVTPEAVQKFVSQISINRTNRTVDLVILENAIRDDLNFIAPRVMAVLRPLKIVISNVEVDLELTIPYFPNDVIKLSPDGLVPLPDGTRVTPEIATRAVKLTKEIWIDREDFMLEPVAGFKRLSPNGRVFLRGVGVIECNQIIKDESGNILELHCKLLEEGEKAKAVIHWVGSNAVSAEFRLYDRLFKVPHPEAEAKELEEDEDGEEVDFLHFLNPNSLEITHGFVEPSILNDPLETRYQFERLGYFWRDPVDSSGEKLVLNRIISLRDTWNRIINVSDSGTIASVESPDKPTQLKLVSVSDSGIITSGESAQVVVLNPKNIELTPEQTVKLEQYLKLEIGESEARILARELKLSSFLDTALESEVNASTLSNWVVNELGTHLRETETPRISPTQLGELVKLITDGTISNRIAKTVLEKTLETGVDPLEIIATEGLKQVSDSGALEVIVDAIMTANPDKVAAFKSGRTGLLSFFVGQVMAQTKGAGNPQMVQEIVKQKLEA